MIDDNNKLLAWCTSLLARSIFARWFFARLLVSRDVCNMLEAQPRPFSRPL